MATTHKILNIKDAQLTLDAVTYGGAIDNANISATVEDMVWKPISGEDQSAVGEPELTLNVNFGQDYSTNTTLTAILITRHGEAVPFILATKTGEVVATGECVLKFPSQIGGGRGVATASVAMRINGTPTWGFGTP